MKRLILLKGALLVNASNPDCIEGFGPQHVCNGKKECIGMRDEQDCGKPNCLMGFWCGEGDNCLSEDQICNGVPNCRNGEDEKICAKYGDWMKDDSACNRAPCNTNCADGPNGQNDCFIQYERQCFDSNANPIMSQVCIDSGLGQPFFGEICPACLNPVTDRSPGTETPETTAKPGTTPGGDPTSNCTMKTFWKCWWFWLIIALLIILIIILCICCCCCAETCAAICICCTCCKREKKEGLGNIEQQRKQSMAPGTILSPNAPRFEPLQESPVSSEASPEQTETQTNSSLISKSLESESKSTFSDSGQSQTYLEVTQVRQVSTSPSSGETQTSSYQSRDSRQRKTRVASVSPV